VEAPPPAAADVRSLTTALATRWSIAADLEYVPKGGGSYHWRVRDRGRPAYFVTLDDLDTKPWIARDRDTTFTGLAAAYETAWALHHEGGLAFVVAPVRSDGGEVIVRFDDRHGLSLFPFVVGEAGTWGEPIAAAQRARLQRELARLHQAAAGHRTLRRRPHELAERDLILEALASLDDEPWSGGPYAERGFQVLTDCEQALRNRLARFDELAEELDGADVELVVTHGEPHPGNLIHTGSGVRLIDWDTVALAEPERDLWMLDGGSGSLDAYAAATGTSVNNAAIEFWRLAWTLSDIAYTAALFRGEHTITPFVERQWAGYVALLGGGSSAPYPES
jgi:spectinomycin phosphotransferase